MASAILTAATTTRQGSSRLLVQDSYIRRIAHLKYTFTDSYATGGDACDIVASFNPGLVAASGLIVDPIGQNGYRFQWDATNKKMLSYTSGGTQTTSSTDLSAVGAIDVLVYSP